MRPERLVSLLAVLGLAMATGVLLAVPAGADETPTGTPTGTPAAGLVLDDAVLRWGVNDESNNRAFAPNTYNFFSAGRVPDPGRGDTTLPASSWSQAAGSVAIEKWDGSGYRPATWAGLSTDSAGRPLGAATAGTFSNHQVVFSGGAGTVDRTTGVARIAWDGDVTVLYYSGMSFFYLTDPVLEVADGRGTLTATVQGYAASREDASDWALLPAATVTLADLPSVDLGELGFVAQPAYLGVRVTGVPQSTGGVSAGSFPQSFVDYADRLGTAAFWYSSGSATDAFKVPLPVSVSYDRGAVVAQPSPTQPTATPKAVPAPTIKLPPTPTASPTPSATPSTTPSATPAATAPPAGGRTAAISPPAVPPAPPTGVAAAALPPATQLVAAVPAAAAPVAPDRSARLWWIGGALLVAAALVLVIPAGPPGRRRS